MKLVRCSSHAELQMVLRGASEREVKKTVETGKRVSAKLGRFSVKCQFEFNDTSPVNRKFYAYKTIEAICVEEADETVIVTVKVYYSNEEAV